jgi:type I restriction enzyme S subunit
MSYDYCQIDWNVLKHYKVPVPKADLLKSYQQLFDCILRKIELSVSENKSLDELRDGLLPMLMNGQVTVQSSTE